MGNNAHFHFHLEAESVRSAYLSQVLQIVPRKSCKSLQTELNFKLFVHIDDVDGVSTAMVQLAMLSFRLLMS